MTIRGQFPVSLLLVLVLLLVLAGPGSAGAARPAPVSVRLTSITIDPEDASGATTNARPVVDRPGRSALPGGRLGSRRLSERHAAGHRPGRDFDSA